MVRKLLLVALAAVLLNLAAAARAAGPKVGDAAPPTGVQTLLNAPEGASADWDKLAGKVVVVEFWATWCGPCVAAIPHMNALADALAGEDVAFISVTREPPERIERFLKRQPMKSAVGTVDGLTTVKGVERDDHSGDVRRRPRRQVAGANRP